MSAALLGADRLPHVLDRRLRPRIAAGPHRAAVEHDRGLVERASAISAAGTVLSQPTRQTSASKSCACAISSIESAITSREMSDARMPGVPCDWLSLTAIVLNAQRDAARRVDRVATCARQLAAG